MGVIADDFVKTQTRCSHCGEITGKDLQYCKYCTTAAGRRECDAENEKIFADAGMQFKKDVANPQTIIA